MKIQRQVEAILLKYLKPGKVNLVVGARRVGKTYLIKKILKESNDKYLWLNGDDETAHKLLEEKSIINYQRLTAGIDILVIDEAQMIENIGLKLKLLVDEFPNLKILATGSSAYALSNSVGEPLVGRAYWHKMFAVAQKELKADENYLETVQNLEQRLIYGSYPELITIKDFAEKERYLKEIVDSYLFKDILAFDEIRNSSKIRNLTKLIAYQVGKDVDYNELARQLGMSKNTVEKYLDLLSKVFVVYKIGGYSNNLRKEVSKSSRWFFYDNGIRNALIDDFRPLVLRTDTGSLWENYLISERKKKNEYTQKTDLHYFWRTYDKQEIDLLEVKNQQIAAFEIKWGNEKAKKPKAFADAYPDASFEIISKENYLDFVGA